MNIVNLICFVCVLLFLKEVHQQQRQEGTGHLQGEHRVLVKPKSGIGVDAIQTIGDHAWGCKPTQQ